MLRWFAAGIAGLLLTAWPAAAQRPDTTALDTLIARLPPIEVIGSILRSAGPQVGSGIPARISTVSAARIEAWEPRLLSDALASQPGIALYDDLGSPFKTTLVTRGFTASPVVGLPQGVSVFIDGVPVNEPDAGQVNFDLIPLEHVQRVELLSGTASLLGPNSLGGAINLVTRRGEGPPSGEIELSGGSFGAYSVEASAGGGEKAWSYYAGGGLETETGWRQLTSATIHSLFANISRAGSRSGLRLQLFGGRSHVETAGSLPLSVFRVAPDSNLTAGDFEDLRQLHVALAGYTPTAIGQGSFTAYARLHDAERFNVNQQADPDVRSFSENRTLGLSADWQAQLPTPNGAVAVRIGASGSVNTVDVRIFAERIDPGITTHVDSPIRDAGLFSAADYTVGRVTVSGGVRYDVVRIPFRNRLDSSRDTTSTFTRFSPKGGVTLRLGRAASVYLSAGQSFRAPAVIELACADPEEPCPLPFALGDDPPLDPVVATTYEAGGQWLIGGALVSASMFRTEVRGDIFLFPYEDASAPEGSSIDGYFDNVDRTRREGIEIGTAWQAHGGAHSFFLNYALTRATFRTEGIELFSIREEAGGENHVAIGDRLPLVPDHLIRAGGELRLPVGLELGTEARYTGRQWLRGDEANEEQPLDSYFTVDLRAGWKIGQWAVQAIVTNVLDTRYSTFGTFNLNQAAGGVLERFLTPGQPRSFRLIVRRSFGG